MQLLLHVGIRLYRIFREAMCASIQQLEQVAKYLGTIATVDFLDYQVFLLCLLTGTELVEFLPCLYIGLQKRLTNKLIDNLVFCHGLAVSSFNGYGFRTNNSRYWHSLGRRLICSYKC